MKKLLALALSVVMAFSMVACGSNDEKPKVETKPETITILGQSSGEADLNILRDQLTKAGYTVEINMQPDYSSFQSALSAGNYDLALTGWTTVTGNVDYAVRGIFHSTGDYNNSPIVDEKIDELVDKGATETATQAVSTYSELESYLVGEKAYIVPLYSTMKNLAYNNQLVKSESVSQPKSRPGRWEMFEYVDSKLNETRPLVLTQSSSTPSTLDPIQANDGTMNSLSGNMYIKIVNLTDDDQITTDSSLSHSYAIAEGNNEYYFLLRDDVFFSKAENGHAANTGVMVGGEDVVYSLERACNKDSVASHKTYTLHNHMQTIEMVTDLNELNTVKDSDTGATILDTLKKGIDGEITALTNKDENVDNANGTYQVIKVTTTQPFPQVLNYLAHQSAGILNKEQVEAYNSKFSVESYDPTKDVCYGDFAAVKSGDSNMLWCSGPYQFISVDDYGIKFEANPGYMADEKEFTSKINNIYMKFIKDASAANSAFRAGEIDVISITKTSDIPTIEQDSKFTVMSRPSNGVTYCTFNLKEGSKFNNVDLRLSVLHAINQEEFVAFNDGYVMPVYSTVGTILETGNKHVFDLNKSAEHLAAYQATVA